MKQIFYPKSDFKEAKICHENTKGGFALIATISVMVLLVMIVLGMLSLSTITLREGRQEQAMNEARANARMAALLALGELQNLAGGDTRITASSTLIHGEYSPRTLGVWRSWEGSDHDDRGRPIAPDYGRKKVNGDWQNAGNDGRFLGWLVSSDRVRDIDQVPVQDKASGSTRMLIGTGSVGSGSVSGQVHVEPTVLVNGKGAYAWMAIGENQKANIQKRQNPQKDESAEWASLAKAHAVPDASVFKLSDLLGDNELADKAVTYGQVDLIPSDGGALVSRDYFYDMTTWSRGLLTNVATGGWRKDLSLLAEKWDTQDTNGLSLFRRDLERSLLFNRATSGNPLTGHSLFYWWGSAGDAAGNLPIYRNGPVVSWSNLVDYMRQYKYIAGQSSGRALMNTQAPDIANGNSGNMNAYLHRVRKMPVVARIHWVFSYYAKRNPYPFIREPYLPQIVTNPVVTLWNPYNVEMIVPGGMQLSLERPIPPAFQFKIGAQTLPRLALITDTEQATGAFNYGGASRSTSLVWNIQSTIVIKPGETKVYSPENSNPVEGNSLNLKEGYRSGGGHAFNIERVTKVGTGVQRRPIGANSQDRMSVDMRFDARYGDTTPLTQTQGTGIYLNVRDGGGKWLLAYRMIFPDSGTIDKVYPPIAIDTTATVSSVISSPKPFASCVFGMRMASDTHMPAKGVVQSSPFVNYTTMGQKSEGDLGSVGANYNGIWHTVNSPFDFSFLNTGPGDSRLPNVDPRTNRGYLVSGFDASTGLSRAVVAELPLRPLLSLAELQHWDVRYDNPVPPYQFNVIANSDASPILPANQVVNPATGSQLTNLQHDDSYCCNHILFDDWFFSSIASEPKGWLARRETARSAKVVFTDFVEGNQPLGNQAYLYSQASKLGSTAELYQKYVAPKEAWRSIASQIEVSGMFNVNSISVEAWKALLRHARNQRVPYLSESGNSWGVTLSNETDYAFSRFTVAGDAEATSGNGQSGEISDAAEFTGYREFTERQLDNLAEKIVEQVRLRGPFLSLAEFVNRQLSSGDLALAGAIQTALNELAEGSGGNNPYQTLQALSTEIAPGNLPAVDKAGYVHGAAGEGYSGYGLPGWTRQADILKAIAPVLSVRDDTFKIRAYGESRDAQSGRVLARAWCEVVVQRKAEFVDGRDEPTTDYADLNEVNKKFGRKMKVIGFRWLSPDEV